MNKLLSLLSISFLLLSCDDSKNETAAAPAEDKTALPAVVSSLTGCWQMTLNKDTAYMELTESTQQIIGPLTYRRFEKDSNSGFVTLKRNGDRAEGWYTFQSEGVTSSRQIIFHLSDLGMGEGYGDVEVRGDDSVYYKYPQQLSFEEKHAFKRVPCVP